MSRGLGKLQRELVALVAEYDDWFFGEYVLLGQPVERAPDLRRASSAIVIFKSTVSISA
jgi:hypothetical protein